MSSPIPAVDVPSCPVCHGSGESFYAGLADRHFAVPGEWTFRRCTRCRHLWLTPRPVDSAIPSLYARYYTHDPEAPLRTAPASRRWLRDAVLAARFGYRQLGRGRGHLLAGHAASRFAPLRRFVEVIVMTLGAPAGRILDVGAGDGAFLEKMIGLGWVGAGLEPDATAAARCRRLGLDVRDGTLQSHSFAPASFDAVTLNHVIEHVADPVTSLRLASQLVAPGGRVVMATPNAQSWGHRLYRANWVGLDPPRHFHVFSKDNLETIVRRSGLTVERTLVTGRSVPFVIGVSRLVRREGRAEGQLPRHTPLTKAAAAAMWIAEELVSPLRPVGEELITVARRDP